MSEEFRTIEIHITNTTANDETFEEYVKRNPMPTQPVTWEKGNKR